MRQHSTSSQRSSSQRSSQRFSERRAGDPGLACGAALVPAAGKPMLRGQSGRAAVRLVGQPAAAPRATGGRTTSVNDGAIAGGRLIHQRTLKNTIRCSGIGLHSGQRVTMTLHPAPADSGVVFRRSDLAGAEVAARFDRAVDLVMCTNLANESGVRVGTVEHLMAALAGCGIDNVLVELDGPEVPVMDGSSAPFVFLIECADSVEQTAPRRYIEILKRVEVRDGNRLAALEPYDGFAVSFGIDFDNPVVGTQHCAFDLVDGVFKAELSRARTFGFEDEVEKLRSLGLALGGSLDNAVVIGDDRVLNEGGLRFTDEFVRHKALDSIGDLYLVGGPLLGRFHGERSGHAMNNRLLRSLFADGSAWRYRLLATDAEAATAGWAAGQQQAGNVAVALA